MTSPMVYLAHPIDYAGGVISPLSPSRASLRDAIIEAEMAVYDPREAFTTSNGNTNLAAIGFSNSAALASADALLAVLPRGVPTLGVVAEIETAVENRKPTAILTDYPPGVQLAMWDARPWVKIYPLGEDPETVATWLRWEPSESTTLRVKLELGAFLPTKSYMGDAGWDLYTQMGAELKVGEFKDIATGVFAEMPRGFYGRITGRSSTYRQYGLLVIEGIIDEGYRGELKIGVRNMGESPTRIPSGSRLAQLLLHRNHPISIMKVEDLSPSVRGERGYGSSGR